MVRVFFKAAVLKGVLEQRFLPRMRRVVIVGQIGMALRADFDTNTQ